MHSTQTATLDAAITLDDLRARIRGDVFAPEDEGYSASHQAWNLTVAHRPALVVVVHSEDDVREAVRYANLHDLKVAVQSTGHGQFRCCEDGMLLVTSRLKTVEVDPIERTARVGAGVMWEELLPEAQRFGLSGLSGSAPNVGIVGYMLGGGYGLMLRKHGLMVDSVRSVRVVTPDGELRTADRDRNADLFWSLLGGGGSYGVVTEVVMDLYPNARVFGGSIMFPIERATEVYCAYADWTHGLSEDVTTSIAMMTFPPVPFVPEFLHGRSVVIVTGCVTARHDEAERLLHPIRNLGGEIVDTFCEHDYADSGRIHQDPENPLPACGNGVLLRDLTPEATQILLDAVGPMSQSPNLKVEIRHLEGAMSRVPAEATAIGRRREAKYLLFFLGVPMGPNTPEAMSAQAERVFAALGDAVLCRGPLNWIGEAHVPAASVRSVFDAESFERLCAAKHRYDPENRFPFAGVGLTLQP